MRLGMILSGHYPVMQQLEFFLRILLACACGAFIGLERTKRGKEAGMRTHILVCCTAALLMIVSKYAFGDMEIGAYGTRGADSARIAAQVVSGISFLCAGVIFKNRNAIKGLTTAAGLWATAAIGLSLGAGMYATGIFAAAVIMGLQVLMHHVTFGKDAFVSQQLVLSAEDTESFGTALQEFLIKSGAVAGECRIERTQDGLLKCAMSLRARKIIDDEHWRAFMKEHPEIRKLRYTISENRSVQAAGKSGRGSDL